MGWQVPIPMDGGKAYEQGDPETGDETDGIIDVEHVQQYIGGRSQEGGRGVQFAGTEDVRHIAREGISQKPPGYPRTDTHDDGNSRTETVQNGFFRPDNAEEGQDDGVCNADGAQGRRIFLGGEEGDETCDAGNKQEIFTRGHSPVNGQSEQNVTDGTSSQSGYGSCDNDAEQIHFDA